MPHAKSNVYSLPCGFVLCCWLMVLTETWLKVSAFELCSLSGLTETLWCQIHDVSWNSRCLCCTSRALVDESRGRCIETTAEKSSASSKTRPFDGVLTEVKNSYDVAALLMMVKYPSRSCRSRVTREKW